MSLRRSYRALLIEYTSLLIEYTSLLIEYRANLTYHVDMVTGHGALSTCPAVFKFRALFPDHGFDIISFCFDTIQGSFDRIYGSIVVSWIWLRVMALSAHVAPLLEYRALFTVHQFDRVSFCFDTMQGSFDRICGSCVVSWMCLQVTALSADVAPPAAAFAAQQASSLREPAGSGLSKEPYFLSKEPCVLSKEPCILSKEPYVRSKKSWVLSKESWFLSKGSWFPSKEPYVISKESWFLSKESYILFRVLYADQDSCKRNESIISVHIRCNTLQHTATHCNTLQHTAPHCNALQHMQNKSGIELYILYSVLQCVAACCSVYVHL